ncbi:hypothetical protein [Niallia sp.]|uniref:hypothetical protein n=1 Tax=Niallia sp. TaxID=2837523 RepID=UPI0028A0C535|nr:hypothetical protein [Niallia sp.]
MFLKFADKGMLHPKSAFSIRNTAILNTAKYVCYAIPILFLAYTYMAAIQNNQTFWQYVEHNPIITILFVIAMLQPFVSVAIGLGMKSLEKHSPFVHWSFIILAAAEFLTGNILVFGLIIWGIFRFRKQSQSMKKTDKLASNNTKYFFFSLCPILFFLSFICMWALLRISGI